MSPLPEIKNWWAVETMVASYNHVYKVVYKTNYYILGSIGVSDYGNAPIASFQIEFLALDTDAQTVVQDINKYQIDGRKYILNFFHEAPSARDQKKQYADLGYDFIRTGPIMGVGLNETPYSVSYTIQKVETQEQLEAANKDLAADHEKIPPETINDAHIDNYVAILDGHIVGWAQLVTIQEGIGYVNQLYTLTEHRRRMVASSLMSYVHAECLKRDIDRMALVSSDVAMGLYRMLGYRPLAFFTALRPKDENESA